MLSSEKNYVFVISYRKQLSNYVPKSILDIGRPKRKEGSRTSGAGDRRLSQDKPISRDSLDGVKPDIITVVEDDTSQVIKIKSS